MHACSAFHTLTLSNHLIFPSYLTCAWSDAKPMEVCSPYDPTCEYPVSPAVAKELSWATGISCRDWYWCVPPCYHHASNAQPHCIRDAHGKCCAFMSILSTPSARGSLLPHADYHLLASRPSPARRDCSTGSLFDALTVSVGAMHILVVLTFLLLMLFVLAELRRLPFAPYRVVNVAARLQMRTRVVTSLFFLLCLLVVRGGGGGSGSGGHRLLLQLAAVALHACYTQ